MTKEEKRKNDAYEMYKMLKQGKSIEEISSIYSKNNTTVCNYITEVFKELDKNNDSNMFDSFEFDKQYRISESFKPEEVTKAINLIDRNNFNGFKIYLSECYLYFKKERILPL